MRACVCVCVCVCVFTLTCSAYWTVAGSIAQVAGATITNTKVSAWQQHRVPGVCKTNDTLGSSVFIQQVVIMIMTTITPFRGFVLKRKRGNSCIQEMVSSKVIGCITSVGNEGTRLNVSHPQSATPIQPSATPSYSLVHISPAEESPYHQPERKKTDGTLRMVRLAHRTHTHAHRHSPTPTPVAHPHNHAPTSDGLCCQFTHIELLLKGLCQVVTGLGVGLVNGEQGQLVLLVKAWDGMEGEGRGGEGRRREGRGGEKGGRGGGGGEACYMSSHR